MSDDRYVQPRIPDADELDMALKADDPTALAQFVVAVTALGDDPEQAEELVRRVIRHPDQFVRGNAVIGVGHLARRFGHVPADLVGQVRAAARDPSDYVRGHAASATADLRQFLGLDVDYKD